MKLDVQFDEPSIAAAKLPLHHILFGLFCYPHITLFLLQHKAKLTRALRIVVGLSFLAGIFMGAVMLPKVYRATRDWAGWLQQEVQTLEVVDGRLVWEQPDTLPYTTRYKGWRIDFAEPDAAFEPNELAGPEKHGVWVTAERAFVWWQSIENVLYFTLYSTGEGDEGLLNMTTFMKEGMKISGNEFSNKAHQLFLQAIPVILLQKIFLVIFPVISYTLMFTAITVLLRNPFIGRQFSPVFKFHLFASVPPLAVATVYASLNLPYLDFTTAFIITFVLYLTIVFFQFRKAMQKTLENKKGPL